VHESAAAGIHVAARLGEHGMALAGTVRHAFMDGFVNAMWIVTAIAILFAVITFVRAPQLQERPVNVGAEAG
jgi:hypothetical protein